MKVFVLKLSNNSFLWFFFLSCWKTNRKGKYTFHSKELSFAHSHEVGSRFCKDFSLWTRNSALISSRSHTTTVQVSAYLLHLLPGSCQKEIRTPEHLHPSLYMLFIQWRLFNISGFKCFILLQLLECRFLCCLDARSCVKGVAALLLKGFPPSPSPPSPRVLTP